jgi:hypothetical protein
VTLFSTNGGTLWLPDPTGASRDLFHTAQAGDERVVVGNEEVRLFEGGSWSNELDKETGPPPWTYPREIQANFPDGSTRKLDLRLREDFSLQVAVE